MNELCVCFDNIFDGSCLGCLPGMSLPGAMFHVRLMGGFVWSEYRETGFGADDRPETRRNSRAYSLCLMPGGNINL